MAVTCIELSRPRRTEGVLKFQEVSPEKTLVFLDMIQLNWLTPKHCADLLDTSYQE